MSRVDRYKHIHEKSRPAEHKKTFNPRKSMGEHREEEPEELAESLQEPVYEDSYTEDSRRSERRHQTDSGGGNGSDQPPRGKKDKKPKKKRKKSKTKRFFKWLVILLILLFAYSTVMFLKGKSAAEHDDSLPQEKVETFNGVKSSNGAKNILILGSDTRGEDAGRADTIMVLQLNGPSKKPKLISFMRDTFVDIPGVGPNKINAAYAYGGAELVRETLKQNFNLDTKYYAKVDFQSFEKIVDSMFPKGVKIDAEKSLNLDGVDIEKGQQIMDGHVLLQYARFRMDEEGDFGRVRRQQQVMSAVMSQMKNPMTLLRTPESLGKLVGYMSTDVPVSFMLTNGPSLLIKGKAGVESLSVPVPDSWNFGESSYAGSILEVDEQKNADAIEKFLNE
ncbi:LCP family protein [Enterococcus faecalis]|uniref:LCP family protein n=1 Tax=Enterococcus faecalis TaxID=1351 RepID=UPI0001B2E7F6|nr:LCP family protein [Enterococcus faecalis]EEU80507.1 PBP 5 synthesis repressor [Enterococcus faecalis Fly1]EGO2630217.1 LCP family protein [Enterococcus faecalis]EGO5248518.1 LCP family protein [Enterococcus faecalis]EGO7616715.1 LCP family protein [Enterococcus faecalis]EGO7618672.1 LCP family protein [Enterococcus faecalis]